LAAKERERRVSIRWPGMRWTKTALVLFGIGLALGFAAVVVGGLPRIERAASALMALGLVLLPIGLFADGHGFALIAWLAGRLSKTRKPRPRPKPRRTAAKRKTAQNRRTPRRARTNPAR